MTVNDVTAGTVASTSSWLAGAPRAPEAGPGSFPPELDPRPAGSPGPVRRVSLAGCSVDLCDETTVRAIVRATVEDPTRPALAVASANLDHVHHFGLDGRERWRLPQDRESL